MGLGSIPRALMNGRFAGVLGILSFLALRFWDPAPLEIARHKVFDLYQTAHPRVVAEYPVTIVDIDERSLATLGQWPWSRSVVAELVDRLAANGAASIGFDVLFSEPDRLSPRRIARDLNLFDPAAAAKLQELPDSDELFSQAIRGAPVVLGQAGQRGEPVKREGADEQPHTSIATIGGDPRGQLIRFQSLLRNLPEFEVAAKGLGLVSIQPERDGIIRRVPTVLTSEDLIVPALSIELLRVARGSKSLVVKSDEAGVRSLVVGGVEIATDRDAQVWPHFSPHDPKRFVSASDVLSGTVAKERIEGKIVLVGTSAVGLFDLKSTPSERVMPGVEIHAQVIESIVGASLLVRPNYALGAEVCLAVAVGLAMVVAVPMLGALGALSLGLAIAALLAALSWYLFTNEGLLLDLSYPLVSSFAVFLLLTFMNYFREEKRRALIRSAFGQYLSAELVEQLIREPDRLVLGGEARFMSILFSDVRGFTAIAEGFKNNPKGLTTLMNRLLTPLSNAIVERRGTIDKYIGDAIMAFWNAPLDDPDPAGHACESALEILRRLDVLNQERRKEGEHAGEHVADMQIGVGISTGTSVVGNMGSDIRFDYSVMGDSVNLASRIEGLTARYGVRILICPETARLCANRFAIVEVDSVRVKGKQEVVTVHTLVSGPGLLRQDHFRAFRGAFHEFREHYNRGDWQQAGSALATARRNNQNLELVTLIKVFETRLVQLQKAPPIAGWNGVFPDALR